MALLVWRVLILGFGLIIGSTRAMLPLCRESRNTSSSWRGCRVQIGGLASRGAAAYNAAFAPTFDTFLNQQLNVSHGLQFESIPLSSDSLWDAVANGLDLIFVNPAQYVCLMSEKGATAIATLTSSSAGVELDTFAGLIITKANSSINKLEDLRGARVEAASLTSLGAAQLQFAEMVSKNLHPMVDFHRLTFTQSQDEVLRDVLNGHADAGFVRHDMFEIQALHGLTRLQDFKVINLISNSNTNDDDGDWFPLNRSTDLSPEWPVAALPHVPHEVTRLVMLELFRLDASSSSPELSTPPRSGDYAGFTRPMNYFDLVAKLTATGFYNPHTSSCPAATSTYDAIVCPPSHFKQAEEHIFCKEGCRDGHLCLCEPCLAKPDPEVVFNMDLLPHVYPAYVDTEAVAADTSLVSECARLEVCATVVSGQPLQARFADRVGASNRLRLGLTPIETVSICEIDGACEDMIFDSEAGLEGSYVLNSTHTALGTHVLTLLINGAPAELSPLLVYVFEAPMRNITCPDGYGMGPELGTCIACTPGKFLLKSAGGSSCVLCPPGHYTDVIGKTECDDCLTGEQALDVGSTACSICQPGSASSGYGTNAICNLCEPGHISTMPGRSSCDECERGFYNDKFGQTNCTQCPPQTTTVFQGQRSNTSCGCNAGLYLDWSRTCTTCPEGMLCELGSDVKNFPGQEGRCSGFFCTFPRTKPGFMTLKTDPLSVYRCLSKKECPGAPPTNVSACAPHRSAIEPACGLCEEGSYMTRSGDCKVCTGNTSAGILVLVAIAFAIAVMVLGVAVNRDVVTQRKPVTTAVILCGVLFTMFQTLSVMDKLSLEWVDPVKSAVIIASALSFDITELRVSCHVPPKSIITSRYLCRQLIAPGSIPLLFIAVFLKNRLSKRKKASTRIQVCNACGTIFSIFFISVVLSAIDPLVCYKHPDDSGNGSSMLSEPAVQCWRGDKHPVLVCIGLIAFILVPMVFLAMCSYAILVYPKIVNSREKSERDRLHAFRFLFFRFKPEAYFYGLLVLFRNLFICLIPAVVPAENIGVQIVVICMMLLASGGMQATMAPWRTFMSNVIDTGASMALVLIVLCGILSTDIPEDRAAPETVGAITLAGSLALVAGALAHSIYCRCCRKAACFDYFLCHHKAGAAAQARYLQMLLRAKMSCSCFLDSDDLKDLSMLFETIKSSVRHFLVLLTRETLKRPWCAGEVTIARQVRITSTAIMHPTFQPLTEAEFADIFSYLDVGSGMSLVEHYIDLDQVVEAFRWVTSQDMPKAMLATELPGRLALEMVINTLQRCRRHSTKRSRQSDSEESVMKKSSDISAISSCFELPIQVVDTVVVSCDHFDLEAIAGAGIVMKKLWSKLVHVMKGDFYLLADAQKPPTIDELQLCLANARAIIVMMTAGTLDCHQQIQVIVGAKAMGGDASTIPVSMPQFVYPNENYYETALPRLIANDDLDTTASALRSFFGLISLALATHANDAILVTQCLQIFERIGEKERLQKNTSILAMRLPAPRISQKTDDEEKAVLKKCVDEDEDEMWEAAC